MHDGSVEVNYGADHYKVDKDGLEARVLRTYPSVLRDLHFYLMATESGYFQAVHYSFESDYKKGIDIRVQYNGKWYNIALMQNTKRSLFFRFRKKARHASYPNDLISIELAQEESERCGAFNLYTKKHIELMLEEIKRH